MSFILKILFFSLSVIVLTGCRDQYSIDELMVNPSQLKKQIERCHQPELKTREAAARCEVVMTAADRFVKLLDEQQREPELFGLRIMKAQTVCLDAKKTYQQARQKVSLLESGQVKPAEITAAKIEANVAETAYQENKRALKVLLAVVGVNSPE